MARGKTIVVVVCVAVAAFIGGMRWAGKSGGAAPAPGARRILYYHDPMHPAYRSDKPGIAPDCGMQLEPVYEGDPTPAAGLAAAAVPGTVRISAERQRLIGLRTVKAARAPASQTVRLLGRIAADPTRTEQVTALADGVIRSVSQYTAGTMVRKGDLLAVYFVTLREVYSAMQSYFAAMSALDQGMRLQNDPKVMESYKANVRLAEELLQTYGVTEAQIRELSRTRQVTRDVEFRAPISGLILSRTVASGQVVQRGAELFRIADIGKVWVLADFFENESGMIRPGAPARVRYQGRTYASSVGEAVQFDSGTRTLRARLEIANPDLLLRPDMFVDVEVDVAAPPGINVPMSAVLDSGLRKVVFVAAGDGVFEPREVVTGTRFGDNVRIAKGLAEGEEVAVSSLFLLDAESRLQVAAGNAAAATAPVSGTAASGMTTGGAKDPVCGMAVDPATAKHSATHQGTKYHFCSESCKKNFEADPGKYLPKMQDEAMKPSGPGAAHGGGGRGPA